MVLEQALKEKQEEEGDDSHSSKQPSDEAKKDNGSAH
jgi:hypothetical protein